MAEFKGRISGIGNKDNRINEISADEIATMRKMIFGKDYSVIKDFKLYKVNNTTIRMTKGLVQAYGYFGYLDKEIYIQFLLPISTQYHIIYAEIDRSRVPNTFKIKVKNNQSSSEIKPNTFRQDILSSIKTGVFQMPLYVVQITKKGINFTINKKEVQTYIENVRNCNDAKEITVSIEDDITAYTQTYPDRSTKVATTKYVDTAVRKEVE